MHSFEVRMHIGESDETETLAIDPIGSNYVLYQRGTIPHPELAHLKHCLGPIMLEQLQCLKLFWINIETVHSARTSCSNDCIKLPQVLYNHKKHSYLFGWTWEPINGSM